ncbi:type II and III secretion system protein [Synergistales bacterium]|nr:type II and III secretion system protein [Synergistales bacterium]
MKTKNFRLGSMLVRGGFFVAIAAFILFFPGVSWGADRADTKNFSNLLSVSAYQMGDADLVINFRGKRLPQPEIEFDGNTTTIVFINVKADKSALRDVQSDSAVMLSSYKAEQVLNDVVISFVTETPVQLDSMRGVEPSDSYALRLVTVERQQRIEATPQVTYQPKTPKVPTGPFASDAKITLDLRDTELRDVFRMFGVHMNRNMIIDPSLPSELVTMTLRDVKLSEAYGYLMKKYDISYEFIGQNTIIIGTTSGLAKISGKEETRVFHIAYADPKAMTDILPNLTRITATGLAIDDRLKNLYVTSTPDILEEVAIVLQRLDHPGRQVMLQVRILEFSNNATFEVETAINAVYDHWWFSYSGANGARGGYVDDNRRGRNYQWNSDAAGSDGIVPSLTTLTTPMQGIWREFDGAFRALESKGQGRAMATPSVIAIDGQKASISLTTNFPTPSGKDENNNIQYEDKEVGPKMELTPRIGRDNLVSIELHVSTGEIIDEVPTPDGQQPVTTERDVTTNVRVRNGEPFVVGGLFSDNKTNTKTRIPVLGNIPFLGELFTYRTNTGRKTQVVMVVVPYILDIPDIGIEQERVMFR